MLYKKVLRNHYPSNDSTYFKTTLNNFSFVKSFNEPNFETEYSNDLLKVIKEQDASRLLNETSKIIVTYLVNS